MPALANYLAGRDQELRNRPRGLGEVTARRRGARAQGRGASSGGRIREVGPRRLSYSKSESTNSAGENSSRSDIFSPTPTNRTGSDSSRAMATAMRLCSSIQLRQHNAGDAGRLGELAGLLETILPGRCVHDEQHFVGRAGHQTRSSPRILSSSSMRPVLV